MPPADDIRSEAPSEEAVRDCAPPGDADQDGPVVEELDEALRAEDAATERPDEPDWEDLAKRKAAELDNFRKQAALRVQKASRDGMKRVASELLPALDDFERALAHAEAEEGDERHTLTKGIRLVQDQLLSALRRAGIEAFSPQGETFDPHLHEAVATTPVDGAASGTVVEVYQAGYRLGDDVLRAAKVVVAA
jgi:molecular chaperone GrpE